MSRVQKLRAELQQAEAEEKANETAKVLADFQSRYEGRAFVERRHQIFAKKTHEILRFVMFGKFKIDSFNKRRIAYVVEDVSISPTTGHYLLGATMCHTGKREETHDLDHDGVRNVMPPEAREIPTAKYKRVRKAVGLICQGVYDRLVADLEDEGIGDWPETGTFHDPPDFPHIIVPIEISRLLPQSVFTIENGGNKLYLLTPRSREALERKLYEEEECLSRCAPYTQACDVRYIESTRTSIRELRRLLMEAS